MRHVFYEKHKKLRHWKPGPIQNSFLSTNIYVGADNEPVTLVSQQLCNIIWYIIITFKSTTSLQITTPITQPIDSCRPTNWFRMLVIVNVRPTTHYIWAEYLRVQYLTRRSVWNWMHWSGSTTSANIWAQSIQFSGIGGLRSGRLGELWALRALRIPIYGGYISNVPPIRGRVY